MFSSGDNSDIPQTIEGQIIVAITIFLGINLTSEFGYKILEYFVFNKDNEIKAYHQIQLNLLKEDKSNPYYIDFEHFLKYKISKLCSQSCFQTLKLKNKFKVVKEKYLLQVLATLKVDYTINDLTNYIKRNYDLEIEKSIDKLHYLIDTFIGYQDYFTDNLFDYYKNCLSDLLFL